MRETISSGRQHFKMFLDNKDLEISVYCNDVLFCFILWIFAVDLTTNHNLIHV